MSSIPMARDIIEVVLDRGEICDTSRTALKMALSFMKRDAPVRRAPGRRVKITEPMRRRVRHLAARTDLTMVQIAREVGLPNQGRVTDILKGMR